MSKALFITGTGTDIGKTYVTGLIVKKLAEEGKSAAYYKAVCDKYDYVTVEGSGGILCPICFDEAKIQLEDVVLELGLSSILIADAGLGTINSVVLTAEYMKAHHLPLKGIIFNHYHPGNVMEDDNIFMCEYMTGLPTLAKVQDGDTELKMDVEALAGLYE